MSNTGYVLLADDNPTDAELTIRALEIGGVTEQVVWVQDGEAALHYVFRLGAYAQRTPGNPRLMLLDLHMPKIDGLDVLAQIKVALGLGMHRGHRQRRAGPRPGQRQSDRSRVGMRPSILRGCQLDGVRSGPASRARGRGTPALPPSGARLRARASRRAAPVAG